MQIVITLPSTEINVMLLACNSDCWDATTADVVNGQPSSVSGTNLGAVVRHELHRENPGVVDADDYLAFARYPKVRVGIRVIYIFVSKG
jgi:hypothetical protein